MGHFMRVADVDSFTKKLQFIFFFWIRASLGTYWWVVTFSHFVKIGSTIKQNLSDYIMLYFELVMLFYRYIKHCQNGKSATTNAHKRSILKVQEAHCRRKYYERMMDGSRGSKIVMKQCGKYDMGDVRVTQQSKETFPSQLGLDLNVFPRIDFTFTQKFPFSSHGMLFPRVHIENIRWQVPRILD